MTKNEIPCLRSTAGPTQITQCRDRFEKEAGTALEQHWLPQSETDFKPGWVWTYWTESFLGVYARLKDDDMWNSARGENKRFWETGDVFEIFLRPSPGLRYYEFHVTPENQRLQLSFSSEAYARSRPDEIGKHPIRWLEEIGLPHGSFESEAQVLQDAGEWRVLARIPLALLGRPDGVRGGERWLASFSRYDCTRGRSEPLLSSTSFHRVMPDFHDNTSWRPLVFS